ncbi:pilus assembly protein PilZ [Maridesulfovibrio sp.]|uniref:pilus assembly protein PilZ n=1 Tax=Maridesulfovibrio sp. TaxID=2795000 RepID=UPI0029F458AE|nr:pilus assembly protein PilZ [Maridesulfovibrio sp.]
MNKVDDRRKSTRIDLKSMNCFFRQCDIAASTSEKDLDITILDISQDGMKFMINSGSDAKQLRQADEIFIRGCIFNDNIGFLSSQKAVTVWKENTLFGAKFTPALEVDSATLSKMIS